MRALIVCESVHHKNTIRIAEAMAEELDARIVRPGAIVPKDVLKHDIIGFGSGIYMFKHHKFLLELVDRLPPKDRKAFVFSTAGVPQLHSVYHSSIKKRLAKKGFEFVGEFSCPGWDTWSTLNMIGGINKGHPADEDIEKAREFARSLK